MGLLPTPPYEFYTDGQARSGNFWSGLAWRSHFKDGKTMLVGCAATSVGRQSCTNRPGSAGRRAGVARWPLKTADSFNRQAICRSVGVHRPISKEIARWSADSTADLEVPLVGRSSHDARPMSPDYLSMLLRLKNREGIGNVLTWPDVAPTTDWRRRWLADTPDNPQTIGRNAIFRPENHGIGVGACMWYIATTLAVLLSGESWGFSSPDLYHWDMSPVNNYDFDLVFSNFSYCIN